MNVLYFKTSFFFSFKCLLYVVTEFYLSRFYFLFRTKYCKSDGTQFATECSETGTK